MAHKKKTAVDRSKTTTGRGEIQLGGQVTSYDVARIAGVSQSAVSRCFQPGASASVRMRAKVRRVALELGYTPNAIARSRFSLDTATYTQNRKNLFSIILMASTAPRMMRKCFG